MRLNHATFPGRGVLLLLLLLSSCTQLRAPAEEPAAEDTLAAEVAYGLAAQQVVMNRIMDLVETVQRFHEQSGRWPEDVAALRHFAAETHDDAEAQAAPFAPFASLDVTPAAGDAVAFGFTLTPFEHRLEAEDAVLAVRDAAGRITVEARDEGGIRVGIGMDTLTYTGRNGTRVDGDMSGAAIEFELEPFEE